MKQWMLIGLLALPLVANAATMRCKGALISEGDPVLRVVQKCGQPLMKEDIIDTERWDAPKIGEIWSYQFNQSSLPQFLYIVNGRVVRIEDGRRN